MNTKTDITHRYSHLTVNVKHNSQTITQITKRNFSYQLFVIGAVMTKACGGGGSSGEGGSSGGGGGSAILIDGGAPIATVLDRIVVSTGADFANEPGDDTYLIDYTQVSGDFQVNGDADGASGFDTVIIQGYSGEFFSPEFPVSDVITISPLGGTFIKFTFTTLDIFERFVFDVDGDDDGLIDGTDFTWLIGSPNANSEIKGTGVRDYIRTYSGDDTIYGGAGDDIIYGGEGADLIDGGDGDNKIFYKKGDGNDVIEVGDGDDELILVGFDEGDILSIEQTGQDLKLNFKDSSLGGSIILKDSINTGTAGVDKIVFDTNADEIEDSTDTIWLDEDFERDIATLNIPYIIHGTDGADTINGGAGYDRIYGYAGNDHIYGGAGIDEIYGGAGDDYIEGGAGIDKIYGGAGNNIIYGNAGNDHIYGGTGNEEIYGGAGNDFIFGSGGDDTIDGGAEFDYIDGGGGDDTIYGNAGDDIIYGGLGNDTIYGGGGNDKIRYKKGEGHDIIDGGAGDDDVLGLREFVVGDILSIEQTGQDLTLIFKDNAQGGSVTLKDSINNDARGIDSILFDTNASGVEDTGETIWLDDYFERDIATSNILYTIHGDDGNDEIYGNDEDNILNGGDGDDTINGYGGDDTIDGGLGIDTIYGGLGIDTIYGEAGNDIIYGNEGIDTIYGGAGNDIISGGDGNDTIFYNKSDGNDEIFGDAGNDVLILVGFVEDDVLSIERTGNDLKLIFKDSSQGGSIILKDSFYDDEQGIDKIVFDTDSNGEDTGDIIWLDNDFERNIATSNIPYTIYGTAGNDNIYGSTGDNRIVYNKGGGDDILEVGDGDDVLILVGFDLDDVLRIERTGQDLTLIFKDIAQGGSIILKNSFNDDATGIDKIVFDTNENGQDSTDIIWLDDDASFEGYITTSNIPYAIYGTAGADTITGSLGNDIINGGAGSDLISGGTGNDTILGGEGNDSIWGGEGNDYIYGNDGIDTIYGNDGIDTIDGGAGFDIIHGGAGDDTIRYKKGEGHDIIDGGDGVDTLILVGFDEGDIENLVQTGDDLKLNFKDTPEGEDGGSVTLENSINYNQTGIDKIVFDADENGQANAGETTWQDENFADYLLLPIYMA